MKKILLIALLTLSLFGNTDSCKLDVYFGNGVWNDKFQAQDSKNKLKLFIQQENPQRFNIADEGVTYNFKYAHNETYGIINHLIETHWQLYSSGQIGELYFSFLTKVLNAVDITNLNEESYREKLRDIIAQYYLDISDMYDKYNKHSFSKGHNVLLVAHSQGNLFGNQIYEVLSDDEKNKFQMVSVGTPANKVAGEGDYTTLHGDLVIRPIPDSLASNANGFGHTFVESYLNESNIDSRTMINTGIFKAVNVLDENNCSKYEYYRWITYMCQSRESLELEVEIYGTKKHPSGTHTFEELITTEKKMRVELVDGSCPIVGWACIANFSKYDKNGCSAYVFDYTSIHTLDSIANNRYENGYTCTTYKMSPDVTEMLRAMQE